MLLALGLVGMVVWSFWPSGPSAALWQREQSAALGWASAMGTSGPPTGIQQISVPAMQSDDKCVTCHINVDRPEFEPGNEIAWLETQASVPNFWETWAGKLSPDSIMKARQIRQPLREQVLHDLPADVGMVLDEQYRRDLIEAVNAKRQAAGQSLLDASPVLLGHPKIGGDHVWSKVGCTSCHEGSGDATDFVGAAHSPRAMWVDATTGSPVMPQELVDAAADDVEVTPQASYVDPVTGTSGTAISQRAFWEKSYPSPTGQTLEQVYWSFDHPMLRLSHVEADCARCHTQIYDIAPAAPVLLEGRRLFATLGCVDCHDGMVDEQWTRKVGPNLEHVDQKLNRAQVVEWVLHPRGRMPPIAISPGEAQTVTDYLFSHSTDAELLPLPHGMTGNAKRGRMLFLGHHLDDPMAIAEHLPVGLKAGLGCVACHNLSADGPVSFGPNLGQVLIPSRRWLFTWLKDPRRCDKDALMPNMRLTDQEAMDLAEFLIEKNEALNPGRYAKPSPHPAPEVPAEGEEGVAQELIQHYGCAQCHEINGVQAMPTINLPERIVLREVATGHGPMREDRLTEILEHPDTAPLPLQKLQMPRINLTDEEVRALVTFVMSKRMGITLDTMTGQASDDLSAAIAHGRALTEFYNCIGCHQTELAPPDVQKHFEFAWIGNYAPPPLYGEGSRVQPEWLDGFLRDVKPIRPLVMMRMPSFAWRKGEVEAVAEYFRATGQRESRDLHRLIADDPAALADWALARGEVKAVQLNPALNSPQQLDETRQDILYKARFIAAVQGRQTDGWPAPVGVDARRVAMGETFVNVLQCAQCHSIGQDKLDAKAPNLANAYDRLNRDWVAAWLQESTILQPETAMPPVFSGLAVHDLNGQVCAKAMEIKDPKKVAQTEEAGQTKKQQSDLLLDFLYAVRAKDVTQKN